MLTFGPHLLEVLIHLVMTYILKPSDFQKALSSVASEVQCSLTWESLLSCIDRNICVCKYINMYNKNASPVPQVSLELFFFGVVRQGFSI